MWMSCLTLKTRLKLAGCLCAASIAGGCGVVQVDAPQAPDRTNPPGITADDALRARDRPQREAAYPCFSTNAGPSEVLLMPNDNLSSPVHAALETPIFLADLAL